MKASAKLLMLCMLTLSFDGFAEENGYYIELSAGLSNGYVSAGGDIPSGKYGGSSVYNIAFGNKFNNQVAIDVEFSKRGDYTNNKVATQTPEGPATAGISISSLSAMLNGYYYYYDGFENFKPYITGGLGVAQNKTGSLIESGQVNGELSNQVINGGKTSGFAWKLGAGVKCRLNSRFDVDLKYQFVNLGSVKTSNSYTTYVNNSYNHSGSEAYSSSKLTAHELLLGLVYKF